MQHALTGSVFPVALFLLLLPFSLNRAAAGEFHVTVDGNDTNDGTRQKPFATLVRARDAVREAKKTADEPITVYLHGGTYHLTETVVFGLEDSAPGGSTITYAALPGETPVLDSGIAIGNWKRLDPAPAGLPEKARGHVWVAEIPKGLGLFRTLYDSSRRLPRASLGFAPMESAKGKKGYPVVDENYDVLRKLAFPKGLLKNSAGDLPVFCLMKYSGMRRPEVELSEPKVKVRSAMARGKSSDFSSPVALLAMK